MNSSRKTVIISLSSLALAGLITLIGWFHPSFPVLFNNFGEVEPGRLFRSGQISAHELEKIVKKYGVKTIICLQGKEQKPVKDKARELGLNLVGVRMRANLPPGPDRLGLLLKIISGQKFNKKEHEWLIEDWLGPSQDPVQLPGPYLVHCQMGADRTGYLIAVYRICFQGWSPETARLEMLRYYHFPPRFPRLWEELKKMDPSSFCPEINPGYKSLEPGKS